MKTEKKNGKSSEFSQYTSEKNGKTIELSHNYSEINGKRDFRLRGQYVPFFCLSLHNEFIKEVFKTTRKDSGGSGGGNSNAPIN